jgi:hypothetical protein
MQKQPVVAPKPGGNITVATAMGKPGAGEDAYTAGRIAAENLKAEMKGKEPHVVILTECFAEKADKEKVAKGVASVFGKDKVIGLSSYGFYTRHGVQDREAVALLALGGDGISVRTAFVPKLNSTGLNLENDEPALKAALGAAGRKLAEQLPVNDGSRLMIVLADTHSPKNQLLLDGIQEIVGMQFPITGGSVNKNAGMNWIHWRGGLYADAAVALMIDGNMAIVQNGAQAKDNQAVLETAEKVASVMVNVDPMLFLAFDCAGRKGKLDDINDEQRAIINGVDKNLPQGTHKPEIFGMWCAGEFGCPEDSFRKPVGRGWHIMGTLLSYRAMQAK